MLRVAIIGPDQALADQLYRSYAEWPDVNPYRTINEYPRLDHLGRWLNSTEPNLVFLDLDWFEEATAVAREIRAARPEVAVIGYAAPRANEDEPLPRLGEAETDVAETLSAPFDPKKVWASIIAAIEHRTATAGENIVAFLPAKAGSGASTAALNVGGALAKYWRQNVLLLETDLHSGCLSVALKLKPAHTIVEALEEADELKERTWERMIVRAHRLDLLLATRGKQASLIAPWQYQHLLAFASSRYDTIVADLPEVVNEATETIVRRAAMVYVVGTPETSSLFLARRRLRDLQHRGVSPDRLGLVLNRVADAKEFEEVLDRKVAASLPNDYHGVLSANQAGALVKGDSALGRAYAALARELAGAEPLIPRPDEPKALRGLRRLFKGRATD